MRPAAVTLLLTSWLSAVKAFVVVVPTVAHLRFRKRPNVPSYQSTFTDGNHLLVSGQELLFDNKHEDEQRVEQINHKARFGGVARLYDAQLSAKQGAENKSNVLDSLERATVVVVGLGGVGSWAAEALCRSGIGHLVLVDLDDVCISNTNRQIHALSSTVGKFKVDVLADRYRDMNPRCHVTCLHDFVSRHNVHDILQQIQEATKTTMGADREITAVVDCIDGSTEKAALLAACADAQLPVVTCGGAAGLVDPSRVLCEDLTVVTNDKLLSTSRKNLRKYHGFAAGKFINQMRQLPKWNINAVYSMEPVPNLPPSSESSSRLCDGSLGTACFVTGTFGFAAAAHIVSGIAQNKLKPPCRN